MAVVINEMEVAPAPGAPPSGAHSEQGGDKAQPEPVEKIGRALSVEHERKRRLAAY
jgi:hypothetical protein